MIRSTELGATAVSLAIINDPRDVVLDAFVDSHWYSQDSVTHKSLKIARNQVIICLKAINLEEFLRLSRSLIPAGPSRIGVWVMVTLCQSIIFGVVEGVDMLASNAAEVREQVTIDKLLLGEAWDLLRVLNIVVAGIETLNGCDG